MLSTERFIPPSTSLRQTVFFAIECKDGVLRVGTLEVNLYASHVVLLLFHD